MAYSNNNAPLGQSAGQTLDAVVAAVARQHGPVNALLLAAATATGWRRGGPPTWAEVVSAVMTTSSTLLARVGLNSPPSLSDLDRVVPGGSDAKEMAVARLALAGLLAGLAGFPDDPATTPAAARSATEETTAGCAGPAEVWPR